MKKFVPILNPQGYHITLVIVVVHGYHSWVGSYLLPSLKSFFDSFQYHKSQSSQGGDFQVSSKLGSVSKIHGGFTNRDLKSKPSKATKAIVTAMILGSLLDNSDQQVKKDFLMLVFGFCQSVALVGVIIKWKSFVKATYVHLCHDYIYY